MDIRKCDSKPSKEDLYNSLTELQYHVTQEDGKEPPFNKEYWIVRRRETIQDLEKEKIFEKLFYNNSLSTMYISYIICENVLFVMKGYTYKV